MYLAFNNQTILWNRRFNKPMRQSQCYDIKADSMNVLNFFQKPQSNKLQSFWFPGVTFLHLPLLDAIPHQTRLVF